MSLYRVIFVCGVAAYVAAAPARAQAPSTATSMVVDIPQDNLYHHPGCSLVKAAGSKVRVMRQGEAVRRGMKPHECVIEASAAENPNAATVYVQKGDSRYHKEGCTKLAAAATKTTVDEAGRKHWPCTVCKPPVRKKIVEGEQQ